MDGSVPTDVMSSRAVLGVWAAASRRKVRIAGAHNGRTSESGPWVQVSRLGNPLFNEVVVPMGDKDRWNASYPVDDSAFAGYVRHPELASLLPVLYPNVFPNLAALHQGARGPGGDPADGDPRRGRPRLPELHRQGAGGHAAAERRDPADDVEPESASGCSAAISPDSRTAGGCSTTSSASSCGRSRESTYPARRLELTRPTGQPAN